MAKISVQYHQYLHEFSPPLCMRCGEAKEVDVPIEFTLSNRSPLIYLLLLLGPLGHVAMALIPPRIDKRRMNIPLCFRHQNHFNQNRIYLTLATFFLVLFIVGFIASNILFFGNRDEVFLGFFLLIITSMIGINWLSRQKVRCLKITSRTVELAGVHPSYASEFNRMQAEFLDAFEQWRIEDRRKRYREEFSFEDN